MQPRMISRTPDSGHTCLGTNVMRYHNATMHGWTRAEFGHTEAATPIWTHMIGHEPNAPTYGRVWPHTAAYGRCWPHMGTYSRIWPHMAAYMAEDGRV